MVRAVSWQQLLTVQPMGVRRRLVLWDTPLHMDQQRPSSLHILQLRVHTAMERNMPMTGHMVKARRCRLPATRFRGCRSTTTPSTKSCWWRIEGHTDRKRLLRTLVLQQVEGYDVPRFQIQAQQLPDLDRVSTSHEHQTARDSLCVAAL